MEIEMPLWLGICLPCLIALFFMLWGGVLYFRGRLIVKSSWTLK